MGNEYTVEELARMVKVSLRCRCNVCLEGLDSLVDDLLRAAEGRLL